MGDDEVLFARLGRRRPQAWSTSIVDVASGQLRTVIVLINDLDIRVVATATGELLRQLTLDPNRIYQPRPK